MYTPSQLQRWALTLNCYDFQIEYVKTTNFGQADVLSRLILEFKKTEEDEVVIATFKTKLETLAPQNYLIIFKKIIHFVQNRWLTKCP